VACDEPFRVALVDGGQDVGADGDHPDDGVAAVDVDDLVQVVEDPFARSAQPCYVPGPDLVRAGGRQFRFGVRWVDGVAATFTERVRLAQCGTWWTRRPRTRFGRALSRCWVRECLTACWSVAGPGVGVGHDGAVLQHELLNLAEAEREPEVQPHAVRDDLDRVPVSLARTPVACRQTTSSPSRTPTVPSADAAGCMRSIGQRRVLSSMSVDWKGSSRGMPPSMPRPGESCGPTARRARHGWVALLPGSQSLTRSHFPCKPLRRRPRSTSTPPAAMTSRPPRVLYVTTALLAPVEAKSPGGLLGVVWPTGALIPPAHGCRSCRRRRQPAWGRSAWRRASACQRRRSPTRASAEES
jgi:hypothetical protein